MSGYKPLNGKETTMAFDFQQVLYHVGVRVPDLEAAMTELGKGLGVTWAKVVERDQPVWTPEDGAYAIPLRFTYSCEGPQHIELLQGARGSLWDGADLPGLHHMGAWIDDVAAETDRLIAAGWTLEMAQKSPEDGYGSMTYVRSPTGFRFEPVSAAVRPRFERWWSGGEFA
jgi:catechol 2,3-dioxygenase-like lactoylglutathione lyase family enzyme